MFKYFLTVFSIFVCCESGVVNILQKCEFTDGNCKSALYRGIIRSVAGGVEEKGIPPLDPVDIPEVTVDLPDSTKLVVVKSQLVGMKDCTFTRMHTDLQKKMSFLGVSCQIKMIGDFKVKGGPDSVDGSGKGEINFGTIHANATFPFSLTKHSDGEVYLVCKRDEITHSYETPEDDIKVLIDFGLGEKNAKVIADLEANSKLIKEKLMPLSLDKSLDFYHAFADKFLGSVPIKNFINTDLTPYL